MSLNHNACHQNIASRNSSRGHRPLLPLGFSSAGALADPSSSHHLVLQAFSQSLTTPGIVGWNALHRNEFGFHGLLSVVPPCGHGGSSRAEWLLVAVFDDDGGLFSLGAFFHNGLSAALGLLSLDTSALRLCFSTRWDAAR